MFITGDRTPFISIIILVLLNLIFNRHIRLKIFYALLIITIIFTIFANFSKVINQRYISDIKNMLRASELNSISLRFQITEYRKELNRLEREILSNKEKNIDNEKNYKDLQIIKDETDRMLLRLKKLKELRNLGKMKNGIINFLTQLMERTIWQLYIR